MKEIMSSYEIEYEQDGITKTKHVMGNNPGHAFAKFQKANPKARVIRAIIQSYRQGCEFWIEYQAPPVQRAPEPARRKGKDSTEPFAFLETVASKEK